MKFKNMELHDSTIVEINYSLSSRELFIVGEKYSSTKKEIIPFTLLFKSVASYSVPQYAPWRESASINGTNVGPSGEYLIELQSGDIITIVASEVEVV